METTELERLLTMAMNEGLSLLDDLRKAEAHQERAEADLSSARERTRLIKERYEANRELATSMWSTLRSEIEAVASAPSSSEAAPRGTAQEATSPPQDQPSATG